MRLETRRDRVVRYIIGISGLLIVGFPLLTVFLLVPIFWLIPVTRICMYWPPIIAVVRAFVGVNGFWLIAGDFLFTVVLFHLAFGVVPYMIYANYGKKAA